LWGVDGAGGSVGDENIQVSHDEALHAIRTMFRSSSL